MGVAGPRQEEQAAVGPDFKARPDALVDELNGDKRPERLTELMRLIQTR